MNDYFLANFLVEWMDKAEIVCEFYFPKKKQTAGFAFVRVFLKNFQ